MPHGENSQVPSTRSRRETGHLVRQPPRRVPASRIRTSHDAAKPSSTQPGRTDSFTEIRLTNFKSVVEQNIPLRSLTVLVGANSSGKSSVLQALLLFVQACQSRSVGDSFPLNGGLVSLGTLTDIRNAAAGTREPVSLGLTLAVPEERLSRASRLGFGGWTDDARLGALQDPLPSMAFDLQDASRVQDEVSITASLNGEVPNEPGAAHLSQLVVKLRRKNSEGDLVDLLELDVHCRLAKSANRHEHRLNEPPRMINTSKAS